MKPTTVTLHCVNDSRGNGNVLCGIHRGGAALHYARHIAVPVGLRSELYNEKTSHPCAWLYDVCIFRTAYNPRRLS